MQATYTRFLPAGMQYCNICCFTMQVSSLANRSLSAMVEGPLETLDLGEHLVVIDDARAFVDRVIAAAEESGYECVMGPVEYSMSRWQAITSVSAGPSEPSSASSQGVADGASHRPLSPRMVEVLAARIGRGAKDFHIARAPRLIRAVLRMGAVFTCGNYNVGDRLSHHSRWTTDPQSANQDLKKFIKMK